MLQKDYKIHHYLINKVITNPRYHKFFYGEFLSNPSKQMYIDIEEMFKQIRRTYSNHIKLVNGV